MNRVLMQYDVAVIGAGPGGLPAAIRAAREGLRVVLVDRNGYVGGNVMAGLCWLAYLDMQGNRVIGGIPQEFVQRLMDKNACRGHARCPVHCSVTIVDINQFQIEALNMCKEAGVDLLLHSELCDVDVRNNRINRVTVFGKCTEIEIEAKIFIDATGDGDLGYLAGAEFEWGRKENGEIMPCTMPFMVDNVDTEKLFSYLDEHPGLLRDDPGISTEFFRKSPDYAFVEMTPFLKKIREEGDTRFPSMVVNFQTTPKKDQVFINVSRIFGIDITDVRQITKAEVEGRLELPDIVNFLRQWVPGFENCRLSFVSPFLGTRESRRLMGIDKLGIEKVKNGEIPADSIALCSYFLDGISQNVLDGSEGFDQNKWLSHPYGIPYGCLVSRNFSNLMMSGRCISVENEVLTSCRIMSVCMAIGEAAGAGAALAVQNGVDPGEVEVQEVRALLQKGGAIVSEGDIIPAEQ